MPDDPEAYHHHHHHDLEDLGVAILTVSTSRSLDDDPAGDAVASSDAMDDLRPPGP